MFDGHLFLSLCSKLLKMSSWIVCIGIVDLKFLMCGLKVYKSQFDALKYIILCKTITSFTTSYRHTITLFLYHSVVVAAVVWIVQMAAQTLALHVGINLCLWPKGMHCPVSTYPEYHVFCLKTADK